MAKHKKIAAAFSKSGKLIIQDIPMKKDTAAKDKNVAGEYENYISAGWLLSKMDLAGGKLAHTHIKGRAVTVAVDAISFPRPVQVGDTVGFYADIVAQGNSSLTVKIESWAERHATGIMEQVTEGLFTFVAVDQNGRPTPINVNPPPGIRKASKQTPVSARAAAANGKPDKNNLIAKITTNRDQENYYGDVFGGWLLETMDVAGLAAVQKDFGAIVATRAITAMSFNKPVNTGEEVSFYTECVKIGTTSITMKVDAWARRHDLKEEKVTEGLFTYVAIDKQRNPVPVLSPRP